MTVKFVVTGTVRKRTSKGIVELKMGDPFTPKKIESVRGLIEAGKVRPAEPCHICHEYRWWLSIYGVLVCGYCHPPGG
ncbi:MAG: hypothetical protein NTU69_08540 [Proteobacteria bacterium]|nr:hypothetical protein [Pseudomonadota bacterium]